LPDMNMALAKDREVFLQVGQNHARIVTKLKAAASGKVHVNSRNDELYDRDVVQEIRASLRAGASIRLTGETGRAVTRRKTPIYVHQWKKIEAEIRKDAKLNPDIKKWVKAIWVPPWGNTGDQLKMLSWAMALHQHGARTLNLNLGPEVIDAARSDSKGMAVYLRRRISRHLTVAAKRLGRSVPEFFFVIEDSDFTEVHLHGGILLPDDVVGYRQFRQALILAGGKWRGGGSARQLDTGCLDTPVRWAGYITKWTLGSSMKIDGRTSAASNGTRSMGQAWYRHARTSGDLITPGRFYQDTGLVSFDP